MPWNIGEGFQEKVTFYLDPEVRTRLGTQLEKEAKGTLLWTELKYGQLKGLGVFGELWNVHQGGDL